MEREIDAQGESTRKESSGGGQSDESLVRGAEATVAGAGPGDRPTMGQH